MRYEQTLQYVAIKLNLRHKGLRFIQKFPRKKFRKILMQSEFECKETNEASQKKKTTKNKK